jgi:hypothetical protein
MKCFTRRATALFLLILPPVVALSPIAANGLDDKVSSNARRPANDDELHYWLDNMIAIHGFTHDEAASATGLAPSEVEADCKRLKIHAGRRAETSRGTLLVVPYPGGRHPRLGFLDGAVRPQRETKVSVFTPWDPKSYVVVDVPEAIWSNLGLTYLAHTHVPTIWTNRNIELEPLEWSRRGDGTFDIERRLPNGIRFGTRVTPTRAAVRMEMWLTNGTGETLSDLRVQMCVMLGRAAGFEQQTNDNKVLSKPYVACRSTRGDRWIITAWEPCHQPWANPPCPCLHSDPKFPDCEPSKTQRIRGWLSFYEGTDIHQEFARIEELGWSKGSD